MSSTRKKLQYIWLGMGMGGAQILLLARISKNMDHVDMLILGIIGSAFLLVAIIGSMATALTGKQRDARDSIKDI